jgi:cyclic pyranopterin phosphate synthase
MRDSFGRTIDYLRISVTDRCNLRCIYCMPHGLPTCADVGRSLSLPLITSLVEAALRHGLRKVRLTGGEPLLRDDIVEVIRTLKAVGVGDLSLTTNGLLLGKLAERLKAAGLDRVNVSLDTMHPGRYRFITGGGSVEGVFEAISLSRQAGLCPVKLNMIPIRSLNDDEIVSFAALTCSEELHVRFIELMPLGNGSWSERRRISSGDVIGRIRRALGQIEFVGQEGSSRNYRIPGARGLLGFISPMSNHFCGSCNRLRITAGGKLRNCLFSPEEMDLRTARSDDDIEKMLLDSVKSKPERKFSGSLPYQAMSQIGG